MGGGDEEAGAARIIWPVPPRPDKVVYNDHDSKEEEEEEDEGDAEETRESEDNYEDDRLSGGAGSQRGGRQLLHGKQIRET